MTGPRFRFDADAALWFAVALLVSAFATLPVLAIGLGILGHALDGHAYIGATGATIVLAFAVATGLLVRARPWRNYRDTLLTLYIVQAGAAVLLAVGQFLRAPARIDIVAGQLLAPLTFGIVQIDSFSPLALAFPDAWPLVGTVLGAAVGRWLLTARGRPVGEPARSRVEPMRLPRP